MTVSRDDLRQWLSSRPSSALALLETLSLRIRQANDSLVEMAFSDVEHRLARLLLRLVSEAGPVDAHEQPVLKITQSELAAYLTVTRESINKQLRLFGRRGWLKVSRGMIVVLDAGALRLPDQAS
jgi:CRP-like cAMP-binding protein